MTCFSTSMRWFRPSDAGQSRTDFDVWMQHANWSSRSLTAQTRDFPTLTAGSQMPFWAVIWPELTACLSVSKSRSFWSA